MVQLSEEPDLTSAKRDLHTWAQDQPSLQINTEARTKHDEMIRVRWLFRRTYSPPLLRCPLKISYFHWVWS